MLWFAWIAGCLDATVSSTDAPPQISWISPVDGSSFEPGEAFNLCAQVSDEDTLDQLALTLTSSADDTLWTQDSGFTECPGGNLGLLLSLSDADQDLLLTAVDSRGRTGQATLSLFADTNSAPWCELHTPLDGQETERGQTLTIEASVGDGEVDQTELQVSLSSDLDGSIWTGKPDSAGGIDVAWSPEEPGVHTLTLRVEDPRGKAHQCNASVLVDPCLDEDEDGYSSCDGDCDDDDQTAFPEAPEEADGADDDCDDWVDEGTVLYDDDGDGWTEVEGDCDDTDPNIHQDATEIAHDGVDQDCDGGDETDADSDGYTGVESGGVDCNDEDPTVHPGADEVWYDGVDQDCEEDSDLDADLDGHDSASHGGDDCDDTDLLVHPGASETWYDGVDQDCDGWSDDDADGDGHDLAELGGDDCDDTNASISPSAMEARDGQDNDCNGACDEGLISPGDLVITEVMQNPDASDDSSGEWFELYNDTATDILICSDWTFSDEDTDKFVLPSDTAVAVPAGGYAVFARDTDLTTNGGVPADHGYATGMQLANGSDELILVHSGTEIDHISWDDGATWPDPTGASMSLEPSLNGSDLNDDGANWCTATSLYGDGDQGTPGAANDGC